MDAERRREAKTDIQPIEHGIEAKWIKQGLHEIMDRDAGLMACVASTYPTDFARAVSFSDFPLTGKALYMLYSKCLLIKDALYRQAAEDDIHSMLILYRSYVDHFLKHMYMYLRFRESADDGIGYQYYHHCLAKNELDSFHADRCSKTLFTPAFAFPGAWDDAEDMPQEPGGPPYERPELERIVTQFYVPKIFEYLNAHLEATEVDSADLEECRQMAFGYIEYKSYVYGEPWTDHELMTISDDELRTRLIQRTCSHIHNASCMLLGTNYAFLLAIAPENPDILAEIKLFRME